MIQTYTHDIETYTQEGVQVEVEGIVCYDNEVVHTHTEIERARAQYRTWKGNNAKVWESKRERGGERERQREKWRKRERGGEREGEKRGEIEKESHGHVRKRSYLLLLSQWTCCTHARTFVRMHTHARCLPVPCKHTCTRTHARTHTHVSAYTNMHAYVMYTQTYVRIQKHTHTHMQTNCLTVTPTNKQAHKHHLCMYGWKFIYIHLLASIFMHIYVHI